LSISDQAQRFRTLVRAAFAEAGVEATIYADYAADVHAIQSLNILAGFTAAGYRDAVGVLSPNVYWWRPSGLRRISTLTPDGPRIEVGTELQAVLETLARR
jgi:hypothetical protein